MPEAAELPIEKVPQKLGETPKRSLLGRFRGMIGRRVHENSELKQSKNPEIQARVDEKREELKGEGVGTAAADRIARSKIAQEIRIERLRQEAKSAYEDPLTKLRSRRWLMDQIPAKIASAERSKSPLYAVFIDVDDLKLLNSCFDHIGGDTLLQQMKELKTREDEPIARFGGDEFVQLVNRQITEAALKKVVERYQYEMQRASRVALRKLAVLPGQNHAAPQEVTLSFGVAKYEGETPDDFLKKATGALLESKKRGKNTALIAETSREGLVSYRPLGEMEIDG